MRTALRLVAFVAVLPAVSAHAHGRSHSYSSWEITEKAAHVRLRISRIELTRLPVDPLVRPGLDLGRYLVEHLRLLAGEEPCVPAIRPRTRASTEGWAVFTWELACPSRGARTIRSDLLLDAAPSHLHFARVALLDGTVLERVLSEAEPRWELGDVYAAASAAPARGTSFPAYLALGIEHILTGWDHLAFVLALLLLAGTVAEVAALVTAFTIAHSVTLGLAVLGVVRPDPIAVEALIGFSIALVSAENGWLLGGRDRVVPLVVTTGLVGLALLAIVGLGALSPLTLFGLAAFALCHFGLLDRVDRPARLRAAVAFAFGLVHGFGFAGVLAELELPTGRLVPALFGFNLGVEVGQLAIVVGVWPVLRLLARGGARRWPRTVAEAGSAAICGLGLFWFVTRTFG